MGELSETEHALGVIIDRTIERNDRAGYFAAMYASVTRTVRARADAGRFEDPARMERFVAAFADRFIAADTAWQAAAPVTASWRLAFETARRWRPIVLQHLLLGINAHINLDLGVTAADLGRGGLDALRVDFDAVNDVLAELVDGCQAALDSVSPWLDLADRIGGGTDEVLINFSLRRARTAAWASAVRLAPLEGAPLATAIEDLDRRTAGLGRLVAHPGLWPSTVLLAVRARERAEPAEVIRLLAAIPPPP